MATRVSNELEDKGVVTTLALSSILVNAEENLRRFDPKRIASLSENIRKNGLLQNLIVSEIPKEEQNGGGHTHKLRAAYRRYNALLPESMGKDRGKAPDMDNVPVLVIPADVDPMSVNMSENGQREEVNYIQSSLAVKRRMEAGAKIAEIAADMGKTVAYVHYLIPLTDPEKMRPAIQKAVAEGKFTFRLARLLPSMSEAEQDAHLAEAEATGSTKGQTAAADKATKARKKKKGETRGRKSKADSSEGGGISAKKAVLLMEETEGELKLASKAEGVTEEKKAAIKDAVWTLQVFSKFLSGAIGAQALGKKLTNKMAED